MIEKYKMIQRLGQGSRGDVYLVQNDDTEAMLAMKIYKDREAEAKRELEVLKTIRMEGVPYLVDCIHDDKMTGIIMEYVKGKCLRKVQLENHIVDEKTAMKWMLEITEILNGFHNQIPTWLYMDLKPENIMLSDTGKIYLIDFGSVIKVGEKMHCVMGTKLYNAPYEDLIPERDFYSLGAIMFELVTGTTYLEGIANGKANIGHLKESFREILQKCVKMNPREGYHTAKELIDDLIKAIDFSENEPSCVDAKTCYFRKKRYIPIKKTKENYIGDTKRFIKHGYHKFAEEIILAALIIFIAVFANQKMENDVYVNEVDVRRITVMAPIIGEYPELNRKTAERIIQVETMERP